MSHRGSIISTLARSFVVSLAVAVALLGAAAPVLARSAPPSTSPSTTGNDISYPQCGKSFPTGQAFGIVGVNGGLANTPNPCLGEYKGGPATSELYWASGSSGSPKLPQVALYVNTADPGPVPGVTDWPTTGTNADGSCNGSDSPACAWQYGWNRAIQDMAWLVAAATPMPGVANTASAYRWWLDVETANSWETGSSGLANNVADLQGMVAAFTAHGAAVGIYSTTYQWGQITGGSTAGNLPGLTGLNDWIPGARSLSAAKSNCALTGFTGPVTITQWFGKPYDGDWAC